jgi:hypothetical protein
VQSIAVQHNTAAVKVSRCMISPQSWKQDFDEPHVSDLIERLASRSQIKPSYDSHHQQPQNDSRSDELDPFLIVREPSMHAIHGQPPSGYHGSSNRKHYHVTPLLRYGG